MKIKIAVEAKVSADRKRCLDTCWWLVRHYPWCRAFHADLQSDPLGRPLRCRACLRNEVRP